MVWHHWLADTKITSTRKPLYWDHQCIRINDDRNSPPTHEKIKLWSVNKADYTNSPSSLNLWGVFTSIRSWPWFFTSEVCLCVLVQWFCVFRWGWSRSMWVLCSKYTMVFRIKTSQVSYNSYFVVSFFSCYIEKHNLLLQPFMQTCPCVD